MKIRPFIRAVFFPRDLRELALGNSGIAAVAVNAVNGAMIAAFFMSLLKMFVPVPLMLLMAVLYGSFIGLLIWTVYPRIECWVGRRLGGNGSLDDLQRIFAWSYLPVGIVGAVCWSVMIFLPIDSEYTTFLYAAIPVLMILFFSIRNYCHSVISVHQFTLRRGAASLFITLVLFVIIPVWFVAAFAVVKGLAVDFRSRRRGGVNAGKPVTPLAIIWTKIAVIVFYAAFFSWVAYYDEQPNPELTRLLNAPSPEVLRNDNAWLALFAFTSPEDGPPFVKESERLRKLKNAVDKGGAGACADDSLAKENPHLQIIGDIPDIKEGKSNGIWEYVSLHKTGASSLIRKNRRLLDRYEKLYAFQWYAEPVDYGFCAPFPRFSPIRDIQKIRFMRLAFAAQGGDLRGALDGVRNDGEFWRFIARNSDTVIAKLISFSMLGSDFRFAAELCAHHRADADELSVVREILRPLDQGETSFAKAFHGEARFTISGIKSSFASGVKSRNYEYPLLKQNATWNRIYSSYRPGFELSELSPREFAKAVVRNKSYEADYHVTFSFLYNPTGEIMAAIPVTDPSLYIKKGHNLEGIRRLAWLKILSGRENIPPAKMQKFLDGHASDFGNPYTGEPMKWNPENESIYFNPVGGGKTVEISR